MSDIVMTYKGVTYTLPASRAFEACEAVEEIAFIGEIAAWLKHPKFAKLAKCTGILLRMAGARVNDDEVRAELLAAYRDLRHDAVFGSVMALHTVLFTGVPPIAEEPAGKAAAGKPDLPEQPL
jgi:hypothetical protein